MKRADAIAIDPAPRVIHLVGSMTDEVFSFVGPATAALSAAGVEQTVVLVDEVQSHHLLPRFHDSVQLVLTPGDGGRLRRWQRSLEAFHLVLRSTKIRALHLHGFLPCLFGLALVRQASIAAPVYYSPHGSRALGPLWLVANMLLWTLQRLAGSRGHHSITNVAVEASRLPALTQHDVDLVESPVGSPFFEVARNESRHPLVVTGSRADNPRGAELYAQLAVLLGGDALRLSFNWIGRADAVSAQRLKAANVGVYDVITDNERASRLATGWIYLAPGGTRGFPLFLAEAMAVGLPCVAMDSDYHRDVIRHGETGFLCRNDAELMSCIAQLIDSPALRERIGQAARAEALQRFGEVRFRESLMAAYAKAQ